MNDNTYQKKNYALTDENGRVLFIGTRSQIRRRFPQSTKPLVEVDRIAPYTTVMPNLKAKLATISTAPGAYLFKDARAKVIYVGKAKNLKNRVSQYFGHDTRVQIPFLISEAVDIDTFVTESELEALFLENTLIKQYLPKYNIKLRDDKNYAFIQIDYTSQIPSIGYVRKVEKNNKVKYFGPFSSAWKIKRTLDLIRRIFPYCANKEIGKRPCFYYYLHRCPGVCVGAITLEEYNHQLERIQLFLSGKTGHIKKELKASMQVASRNEQYETAARLRDQLQALQLLDEHQIAQFPAKVDWDFVSAFIEGGLSSVSLLKVREGKLIDKESFIYSEVISENQTLGKDPVKPLQSFLQTYYADTTDIPREIYIERSIPNLTLIKELLKKRSGRNTPLNVPTRGKKLQLIKLGVANAEQYLRKWETSNAENLGNLQAALEELKEILHLSALPRRIEGYDISNIQGTNPVGSMVVTKDGLPAKSEYRKFKITTKSTPDDFTMMKEMLKRRLHHLASLAPKDAAIWETPDLLMIDGGKGQLSAVVEVLNQYNIKIPVIGLAKRIEEIFLPGNPVPIVLPHSSPTLHILQRLRDEAHRFAITFHRSLRSKQAVKSELDTIAGIGPATKKILKRKFGTITNIRSASLEELSGLIGKAKATLIKKSL